MSKVEVNAGMISISDVPITDKRSPLGAILQNKVSGSTYRIRRANAKGDLRLASRQSRDSGRWADRVSPGENLPPKCRHADFLFSHPQSSMLQIFHAAGGTISYSHGNMPLRATTRRRTGTAQLPRLSKWRSMSSHSNVRQSIY